MVRRDAGQDRRALRDFRRVRIRPDVFWRCHGAEIHRKYLEDAGGAKTAGRRTSASGIDNAAHTAAAGTFAGLCGRAGAEIPELGRPQNADFEDLISERIFFTGNLYNNHACLQ